MKQQPVRSRILAAAEEQLTGTGYSAMTMDRLANELGMSKRTLYENFRSKDALIESVFLEKRAELTRAQREVMESEGNLIEKIHRIAPYMQKCLGTVFNPRLLGDLKRNAPALWQTIKIMRKEKIETMWTAILTEGKSKGYVRKKLDTAVMIAIYTAAVEKLFDEYIIPGVYSQAEARGIVLEVFLNGILTDKGKAAATTYSLKQSSL